MAGTTKLVEYACVERIATIALNRPEKLNAFTDGLTSELSSAVQHFDQDGSAELAILCGNGRAFSSGADVHQGQLLDRHALERSRDPMGRGHPFAELLRRCEHWKPVIAAVHGYALGMALGLALECDLIVAEEGTRFQITEIPRGLGGYRHWALLRARGAAAFADEVSLTGGFFSAEEARAAGIVSRLASRGMVRAVAAELAAEILKNPPLGVRETVRIRRWHTSRLADEVAVRTEGLKLHLTEDFAEATRAFAEKRKPGPFKAK
jgi:enoyl-CoA hydratase/carnithine racemase